jgi:hypothetical protein
MFLYIFFVFTQSKKLDRSIDNDGDVGKENKIFKSKKNNSETIHLEPSPI